MTWTRKAFVVGSLVVVGALAGCGGSDGAGGGGGGTLNAAFAGSWVGTSTLTAQGYPPLTYQGGTVISVSGSSATLANVCPSGGGSIVLSGSGNTATWSGTYSCPAVSIAGICSSVVFTATLATATLSADGATLTAQASGNGVGCGGTLAVTLSFVGTKV